MKKPHSPKLRAIPHIKHADAAKAKKLYEIFSRQVEHVEDAELDPKEREILLNKAVSGKLYYKEMALRKE